MSRLYLVMVRLVFLLSILVHVAQATHLRGGYISVKRISSASLTCKVTVSVFVNTGSPVNFGGGGNGELRFGDGTSMIVPELTETPRPDLGPEVGLVEFVINHQFPREGDYLITYTERNRNAGIINMSSSVNTRFHIESYILLDNQKPAAIHPVNPLGFRSIFQSSVSFSVGAHDSSDYRLQYSLITPKQSLGRPVVQYSVPAGVSLNPFNGLFSWIFPPNNTFVGEYAFAVRVEAYDQQDKLRGFTVFDFQVMVIDAVAGNVSISDNRNLDENNRIYTATEESITITFQIPPPPFAVGSWKLSLHTFLPAENASLTISETSTSRVGLLRLKNTPSIQRTNPYLVVVRASISGFVYDIPYLFFTQNTDYNNVIPFPEEIFEVENPAENSLLYPNPTDGFLFFEDVTGQPAKFSILKLTGEEIASGQLQWSDILDLWGLAPGMYIVRINDEYFRIVKK